MYSFDYLDDIRKMDAFLGDFSRDVYTKDLWAEWRLVADGKRRLKEERLLDEIRRQNDELPQTLAEVLNIWYIWKMNPDENKMQYYLPEKDENWKVVVDHENKQVKFICEETGEHLYETFIS